MWEASASTPMTAWPWQLQASWEPRLPTNTGFPGFVPSPLGTGGALEIGSVLAICTRLLGNSQTLWK